MAVVGALKLVFDQHPPAGVDVLTENIRAEAVFSAASISSSIPNASPSTAMFSGRASQGVKPAAA
jgi:hypothetical protein